MSHGFLNVFGAGILAHGGALPPERIESCLADQQAASFVFDEDGLAWRDARVGAQDVLAARLEFMTGFGSCSFDEPRDDLRELGLLAGTTRSERGDPVS
jgi:hypothetical protein